MRTLTSFLEVSLLAAYALLETTGAPGGNFRRLDHGQFTHRDTCIAAEHADMRAIRQNFDHLLRQFELIDVIRCPLRPVIANCHPRRCLDRARLVNFWLDLIAATRGVNRKIREPCIDQRGSVRLNNL